MILPEQRSDAARLLRDGWSDEAVQRFTALSLEQVLALRAEAAAGPAPSFIRHGRSIPSPCLALHADPPARG